MSGTILTVHEGHLALEEWGGTPSKVLTRWTFLTNPDGSLEKVVRHDVTEKAKSFPKIACKVIQFKTFADQPESSIEAPHLDH